MANEKSTETMISRSSQPEAEEVMEFLRSLDQNEQKDFMVFIQGIKFAKRINPIKRYRGKERKTFQKQTR